MYDVIIIGSGPAGLTASIYNVRAGFKVLVIAGNTWGGQLMLTTLVENYPGFSNGIQGPDLMQEMRSQAENLGVEFLDKDAVEVDVSKRPFSVYTELPTKISQSSMSLRGARYRTVPGDVAISTKNKKIATPLSVARHDTLEISKPPVFQAKSLILASGADTKWLEVPGEQKLIGRGVSSCAPCDAFFFKNKDVAVVGGGDTAMEEALVLARVVNSVTIIHRRDQFRASKIMQEKVFANPKIKVVWNTEVVGVLGAEKVTGVRLKSKNEEVSIKNEYREWEMSIDGIFVAIGHKPNSEKFTGKIDLDEKGFVIRHEQYEGNLLKYWSSTSVDGVFVAGDVHDYRYKQAVTAAGFGCIAALDTEKWLDDSLSKK